MSITHPSDHVPAVCADLTDGSVKITRAESALLYESPPDCVHFANVGQFVWWMFWRLPSCDNDTQYHVLMMIRKEQMLT